MGINTADFAALAVTIVLFAVIYYLDYKKGVDFGLLTLLGTVFGIAVGLGFGNHFTYVEIFGRIYTNVLTALVVPMLLFSINRKYHKSKRIHSFKENRWKVNLLSDLKYSDCKYDYSDRSSHLKSW